MSGAPLDTDAPRIGIHFFPAPQHALAVCLLASVAVHALVFVWLPGRTRLPAPLSVPILEVVMVPDEPEPETLPVALPDPAPQMPRRVEPRQRRTEVPPPVPREPQSVEHAPVALTKPAPRSRDTEITSPAQSVSGPVAAAPVSAPVRVEAAASTPPVFKAAYLRNPPPRYPPAARRNGHEGRVMLKVLVNPDGAPARVEIDQSSGSPLLDGAALDAVRGWRFVPARRGAQNVEGWVRVPLVFRLDS